MARTATTTLERVASSTKPIKTSVSPTKWLVGVLALFKSVVQMSLEWLCLVETQDPANLSPVAASGILSFFATIGSHHQITVPVQSVSSPYTLRSALQEPS